MAVGQQHIIEKLHLEVNLTGSKKDAEEFSRRLGDLLRELLLPRLEGAFDQMSTKGQHLTLPELNVDVDWANGRIDVTSLLPILQEAMLEQLRIKASDTIDSGSENKVSEQDHILKTLRFVLENAHYPWWWKGTWEELEAGLKLMVGQEPGKLRAYLRGLKLDRKKIRDRLLQQLSLPLRKELLHSYWGHDFLAERTLALEQLQSIMLRVFPTFRDHQRTGIQDYLFSRIAVGELSEDPSALWTSAMEFWISNHHLRSDHPAALQRLKALSQKRETKDEKLELFQTALEQFAGDHARVLTYLKRLDLTTEEKKQIQYWLEGGPALPGYLQRELFRQLQVVDKKLADELLDYGIEIEEPAMKEFPDEGIYVQNSGLVLLHPYLMLFFQKLGLCRDTGFVSRDSQEKAVHILQYLASGKTQVPEAEMVLNKVLCGLMPEDTVRRNYRLGKKIKQEADSLLSVVLNYWKALGGTSTDGLRANFLLREGKLIHDAQGWKLIVERLPQDILLEQLPWGFGVIKLQWMEYKMFVEW